MRGYRGYIEIYMTVDGTPLVTFTTETDTINLDLYFRLKRTSFENLVNVKVREAKREGKTSVLQKAGKREGSVKLREGFREG